MNVGEKAMASACRMLGISYDDWAEDPNLRGAYSDAKKIATSALDLMGLKRSSIAIMLKVSTVTVDTTLAKVRLDPYLNDMGTRCYEMIFLDRSLTSSIEALETKYLSLERRYDNLQELYKSLLDDVRMRNR